MIYTVSSILAICILAICWTLVILADKVREIITAIDEDRDKRSYQHNRLQIEATNAIAGHMRDMSKVTQQIFRDQQIINDQHMESLADIYSTTLTTLTNNQEIATQHLSETVALATGTIDKILEATVLLVNPVQPTQYHGEQPPLTPNFYETTVAPFENSIPEIPEPMFYDQNPDIPNEGVQITEPSYGFVNAPDLAFHPSQMPPHLQAAFYGPGGLLNNGR